MYKKILVGCAVVLMLTTLGSAFISRDINTGLMVENGVYFVEGTEMHTVKDVAILVNCTIGQGTLNSTFNITAEAIEHLGLPKLINTSTAL